MEDKKQSRRYFTDKNYRHQIQEAAYADVERSKIFMGEDLDKGTEHYHPIVDQADLAAEAVLSQLSDRSGIQLDFDPETNHEIADTLAEIIRHSMAAQVYERPPLDYTPFVYHDEKWPFFDDNEIRSEGGTYTPHEVRQQLFNRMIDKAMTCGQEEGNYTPTERCMRTVHGVIGLIDGKGGNRSDGKGLPVMQLMICPSPEYSEERARKGLPLYDNSVPLDCGLPAPDYETGLTRAFEDHYTSRFETSIRARQLRAAKDLFGS